MKFAIVLLALFAVIAAVCAEVPSDEYLPPVGGEVSVGGGDVDLGEPVFDDGGAVLTDDGYRYRTHRARRIRYRHRRYRHRY